jgi:hypothetical protein
MKLWATELNRTFSKKTKETKKLQIAKKQKQHMNKCLANLAM